MPPVEAYRVSKHSTKEMMSISRCWWGPWFALGWISQESLDQTKHVGLAVQLRQKSGIWDKACNLLLPPYFTPCSSHLGGSWLIDLFKHQKLCYWTTTLAEATIAPAPVTHYCILSDWFSAGSGSSAMQPYELSGCGQGGETHEVWREHPYNQVKPQEDLTCPQHHHYCKAQEIPALLVLRQLKSAHRKDCFFWLFLLLNVLNWFFFHCGQGPGLPSSLWAWRYRILLKSRGNVISQL